jgi:NTP pyrophosphatase (non-canonical NTP hydrolase)
MDFNQYQALARSTAIYPEQHRVVYPALGLAGESGEVAEKIKKMLRDDIPEEVVRESLVKELGDVLWYVANLAHDLSITLDEVAHANVSKLLDRSERGVLQGSGDNR